MERLNLRRLPADWDLEAEALLNAIDDAPATPVDVERRMADEWFDGVHMALDELETLSDRDPAVALALLEHLVIRLDGAGVDDSDGELARRLGELRTLGISPFGSAGHTHRSVLGPDGLRLLRELDDAS